MLYLEILGVGKIFDLKELLHALHARGGEVHNLVLLIDDKVPCLLLLRAHHIVHLGHLRNILAALHLPCKDIAHLIEFCGFAALSRYDQRCPRLVDQHGVHLVYDGVVQLPQDKLLLVEHHVVPQIVKAEFVVGHIGDIAVVRLPPLIGFHVVEHDADSQPQEFVHLSHPLGVSLCQIVVDGDDMHASSLQRIQICRQKRCLRLSLTGPHLRDTPLVQDDTADQLHSVMLLV